MDPLASVPSEPPAGCDLSEANVNKPHVVGGSSLAEGGTAPLDHGGGAVDTQLSVSVGFGDQIHTATDPAVESDRYQNGGLCAPDHLHTAFSTTLEAPIDHVPDRHVDSQDNLLASQLVRPVHNQTQFAMDMVLPDIPVDPPGIGGITLGHPGQIPSTDPAASLVPVFAVPAQAVTQSSAFASLQQSYQDSPPGEDMSMTALDPLRDAHTGHMLDMVAANPPISDQTVHMDSADFPGFVPEPLPDARSHTNIEGAMEMTPAASGDSPGDGDLNETMQTPSDTGRPGVTPDNMDESTVESMDNNNSDTKPGPAAEETDVNSSKPTEQKPFTYANEKLCKQTLQHLNQLRNDAKFCDAVIRLKAPEEESEQDKYVHRCVLAASSSKFQTLFKNHQESFEDVSISTDCPRAFDAMLDYLYTGDLLVTMSTVDELLFLANQYQLGDVLQYCDRHLQRFIETDNWTFVFNVGSSYNLKDTVQAVENFAVTKFMTVVHDPNILELPETIIEPIIRRCNPRRNLNAEVLCLQLVINWTIHQYEERQDKLADFLGYIRKKLIPQESLDYIFNGELLRNHEIYTHQALADFRNDVLVTKEKINLAKKAKEEEDKKKRELMERETELKRSRKRLKQKLRQQRFEKRELEKSELKVKQERVEELNKIELNRPAEDADSQPVLAPGADDQIAVQAMKTEDPDSAAHQVSAGGDSQAATVAPPAPVIITPLTENTTTMDTGVGPDSVSAEGTVADDQLADYEDASADFVEKHAIIDEGISRTEDELRKLDGLLLGHSPDVMDDQSADEAADNDMDSDWEPPPLNDEGTAGVASAKLKVKGHRRKSCRPTRVTGTAYSVSPNSSEDEMKAGEDEPADELAGPAPRPPLKRGRGRPPGSRNKLTVKLKKRAKLKKLKSLKMAGRPRGRPRKVLGPGEIARMKGRVKVKHRCSFEGCTYSSWRKCDLEDHINSHTGTRPHMCSVCNKGFVSRKHLRRHKYIHLDGKSHNCEYCDYTTVRKDKVKEHLRLHHPEVAVERGLLKQEEVGRTPPRKRHRRATDRPPGIATLTVGEDGKITMATQTLSDEENQLGEEATYEDGFPKGPLPLPAKKRRRRAKAVPSETGAGLVWKCDRCEKEFDSSAALNHHRRGHGADNPYLCEVCGFSTVHYASMRMHKKIHRGETHKCSFEGCVFETIHKSRLEDHVNKHFGIKNHVCSVCGKAFGAKKHMQRHEKLHADVKPITCEYCDYRTTRRDKLRDHLKIHHQDIAIIMGMMHPDEVNKPKGPRPRKPRAKKPKKEPLALPMEQPTPGQTPNPVMPTVIGTPILHQVATEEELAATAIDKVEYETRETISRDPQVQTPVIAMPLPAHLVGMTTINEEMMQYLTTLNNPQVHHQHHTQHHLLVPAQAAAGHVTQQAAVGHQQQHQPATANYHEFYTSTTLPDNVYR